MQIRLAATADLPTLVAIYNQAVAAGQKTGDLTPLTTADRNTWFSAHPADKYPILVACLEGQVFGYLSLAAYRPGRMAFRHTAEVSYYVDFPHHGKGVASRLMQQAIALCPSLQLKTLIAILIDSNHDSLKLLKRFNFKQWGQLPNIGDFDGVEVGHLYYGLHVEKNASDNQ